MRSSRTAILSLTSKECRRNQNWKWNFVTDKSETAIDDEKPKEATNEEREEEVEASEESTKVEKNVVDEIVDLTRVLLLVWAASNKNNPA